MPPFGIDEPHVGPPVGLIVGIIMAFVGLAVISVILRALSIRNRRRFIHNQHTSGNANVNVLLSQPPLVNPGTGVDHSASHHMHHTHHHHVPMPPPAYSPSDAPPANQASLSTF